MFPNPTKPMRSGGRNSSDIVGPARRGSARTAPGKAQHEHGRPPIEELQPASRLLRPYAGAHGQRSEYLASQYELSTVAFDRGDCDQLLVVGREDLHGASSYVAAEMAISDSR